MRILYVADGRSPITLNWLRYWEGRGHEIYLASTFPCLPNPGLSGLEIVPVAFSGAAGKNARVSTDGVRSASTLKLRTWMRQWLGPLTISRSARKLRGLIERLKPDFIHAMRIPYEGMLAADACGDVPLIISVWGNDFSLHAPSTPLMREYTSWTMKVASGLHADCYRDIRLAKRWGYGAQKPTLVVPGNGGIRMDVFCPASEPPHDPVVVNPRGFRAYVRNDVFFQAIPRILARKPEAHFLCVAMAGQAEAIRWVERLGVGKAVELLPVLPHEKMAEVFRRAMVAVSPSTHDGTPNTLLEAMACGCVAVAGDLESIREWITPGVNGLLVDPSDPGALAEAVLYALDQPALREKALKENASLISMRADYQQCMARVEAFYRGFA